jgi:hypothetical protein
MAKDSRKWKRGRGKLGIFTPLLGNWQAKGDSERGPVTCFRSFSPILNGKFIQLSARWEMDQGNYEETAILGTNPDGKVAFWSFTSDGKNSAGLLVDVTDIHPEAIGFEAQMPAGLARMAYWPDGEDGYYWAVEARVKAGWRRFTEHHYQRV